jgi:hypothetical protein
MAGRPGARLAPASSNQEANQRETMSRGGEGGGVHLSSQEWRPFIGGRGSTKDGLGRPGHRACRLWEGQGVALARRGHVRWCCGDVGDAMAQQGDEGEREDQWPEVGGPGVFLLLSFGSHGRGPGWGTGGSTAG